MTFAEMETAVKEVETAMRTMLRYITDLRGGLAKIDDRVGALGEELDDLHDMVCSASGHPKYTPPPDSGYTVDADDHIILGHPQPPAADDPDAPVLCPGCGVEMEWGGCEYECPSNHCDILEIQFAAGTSEAEAAAIVRRMRGAR